MSRRPSSTSVKSRRGRRARLLAWSAPVTVIMFVIAAYVLTTSLVAIAGLRDFGGESYGGAESKFAFLTNVNVVETWKAPYDVGTARYAKGEAFPASLALERALELVPKVAEHRGYEECLVATNLSLAYEALGDGYVDVSDTSMATSYYEKAIGTIDGCTPADDDSEAERDKQLRQDASDAQERQKEKLAALQDPEPDPSPSPEPSPEPSPDPSADPSPQPSPSPSPEASPSPEPSDSPLDELRDRNKDANGQDGGGDQGTSGDGGGAQYW